MGFGVALAMLVLVVSVAMLQMQRMHEKNAAIVASVPLLEKARDIEYQIVGEEMGVRGYVASGDQHYLDDSDPAQLEITKDFDFINDKVADRPHLKALMTSFNAQVRDAQSFLDGETALVDKHDRAAALKHLLDGQPAFERVRATAAEIAADSQAYVDDASAAFERARVTSIWTMFGIGLLAFALCAGIALVVGRRVSQRLGSVAGAIDRIVAQDARALIASFQALAEGDLGSTFAPSARAIPVTGSDEIAKVAHRYNELTVGLGAISEEFALMTGRLRDALGRIDIASAELIATGERNVENAEQIATDARTIGATALHVSTDARDQRVRVESVSGSLEELNRTADQIATGSEDQASALRAIVGDVHALDEEVHGLRRAGSDLAAATEEARAHVENGRRAASASNEMMSRLQRASQESEEVLRTLERRTGEIGEIVATIDGIADQTNLLALNAAIEAARAGENGRGFAVVADEVRKLAESAAAATRQIAAILTAIRQDSQAAVAAARAASKSTQDGAELAASAEASLVAVESSTVVAAGAASMVEDQVGRLREMSRRLGSNIDDASAVVVQNANSSHEMRKTAAAAFDEMLHVLRASENHVAASGDLANVIGRFERIVGEMDQSTRSIQGASGRLRGVLAGFGAAPMALAE